MATYEYLTQEGLVRYNNNIKATYPTKTAVTSEIASAIAGVTQFDYDIVDTLPVTGEKGVIYLVANSGSGQNVFDEYIWIETTEGTTTVGRYELFGTKELSVVEYVGDGTYVTVTDGTGAQEGKKVVNIASAKQSLIDGALQSVASSGSTVTITGEGPAKNLEVSSTIVSGASAGASALQPSDVGPISDADIDALFA